MHGLCTHTMHKRTMLNLASSSGGTPMPTPHSLWAATSKATTKTKAFIIIITIIKPATADNTR